MRWIAIVFVWLVLAALGVTLVWLMPTGSRYSIAIWVVIGVALAGYNTTRLMVPEVDKAEDDEVST